MFMLVIVVVFVQDLLLCCTIKLTCYALQSSNCLTTDSNMQEPTIRRLASKGLEALSVKETGQLLSRLGAHELAESFQKNAVSNEKCDCVRAKCLANLTFIGLQINGAVLRQLKMGDIAEIAPRATRVERKLLLRTIQDIRIATEVSLRKLSTENEGLLRQLNEWFPGNFRTATGTPLYAHEDTTVVQATHKVVAVLDLLLMLLVVCNDM